MFKGRVALVTGGTRGIGAAITEQIAKGGAHVAAGYNRDTVAAEALKKKLVSEGCSVSIHQGNIGQPADCERVTKDVLREYGHIDFHINNAGINVDKTVRKMTIEEWHAVLRINLSGSFYMTKTVLEHMFERGSGRIVYISSLIGQTGNFGQANYAASKSGLFGLTKTLALETARKGITVNCVAPGFIATEMVSGMPEDVRTAIIDKIPVRRLGTTEEVARAVTFLLEETSAYITGAVIPVNGGMEM